MRKIICLVGFLFAGTANAGLIGDTVHMAHNFDTLGTELWTPMDVTVSGGVEGATPYYSIDIDDYSILINTTYIGATYWLDVDFNGLVISELDTALDDFFITTNYAGWDDTRFEYANDSLMFNWSGLDFDSNTYFQLTFSDYIESESEPRQTESVPEPTTLALLGLGLVGIGFARRKKSD